jgi:hypothetical protein
MGRLQAGVSGGGGGTESVNSSKEQKQLTVSIHGLKETVNEINHCIVVSDSSPRLNESQVYANQLITNNNISLTHSSVLYLFNETWKK